MNKIDRWPMPTAFVLINAELGKEEGILKELRSISNVTEAHFVYGVYDIIAKVEADTMEKLKEIVTFKIRRLTDVRSTLTMTVAEGI
ncbi:Lrp/AsnC family transcriptional regulator [Thermoproteota archaeon]